MSLRLFKENLIKLIDGFIENCREDNMNEQVNAFNTVKNIIKNNMVEDKAECIQKGKLICEKCNKEFNIDHRDICPICFADTLYEYAKIEDIDKRVIELSTWINILCTFEYQRGKHNIRCDNKIDYDGDGGEYV